MSFQAIYNAFETRPKSQSKKHGMATDLAILRDNFSVVTWLLIGATLQAIAILTLPYRNISIVLPVFLFVIYKLGLFGLRLAGILPNPLMANVIPGRTTPIFPSGKNGVEHDTPAGQTIGAIMLGARSNSVLGMFDPNFGETAKYFEKLTNLLESDPTKYGYLGSSSWISSHDRRTSGEVMGFLYFENVERIHEFAHAPLHTEATLWWNKLGEKNRNIGLMHEIFNCPKNGWEGVYLNYAPTGLGATFKEVALPDGKKVWVNPLVRAKGQLAYSAGRLGIGKNVWSTFDREKFDTSEE